MFICVFPGTFNPIHNGHIQMAEFALKKYRFDKIIFIPAYLPPHKEIKQNLAGHRLNMVKLATAYNKQFEVSDIEYTSSATSYSLYTVQKIREMYKIDSKLNFLIGTDAFINIESWFKAEELKRLVHFIVFLRKGSDYDNKLIELEQKDWDFEIAPAEYYDVSSTIIRKYKDIKNTSKNVGEYIKTNELY